MFDLMALAVVDRIVKRMARRERAQHPFRADCVVQNVIWFRPIRQGQVSMALLTCSPWSGVLTLRLSQAFGSNIRAASRQRVVAPDWHQHSQVPAFGIGDDKKRD